MTEIEKGILVGLLKAAIPTIKGILGNTDVSEEVTGILMPIISEIELLLGK